MAQVLDELVLSLGIDDRDFTAGNRQYMLPLTGSRR